ncbi:threonine/serine dehydratase [Microbispora sp. KK1-11]|uniref:threonine ammonia-lyase n=1 Tax=Microbispora sp. KK1-11 TaxID=2053005 RepID=UPI001158EDB3|nr:pyridoxal-phosphate dependent enzyme [Microbispora sp. KK1-11]TQS26253.1 pyridoxal-phosphate dependent enzyme [Microbispora sp. KK1-11]
MDENRTARTVVIPRRDDVENARRVVRAHLRPTPVDPGAGTPDDPALKLESLQPTGSFKVRGALNAVAAAPAPRVVTASAGNHGLGVAFAANALGGKATVVVPRTASAAKTDRLRRLDVDLVRAGESFDEAEEHALALAEASGWCYISAYNDPYVIAGQGTIGAELDEQLDGPLTVVCAIGGGGLASGLALWAAGRADVRVVGVEAAASTAVSTAVAAGRRVPVEVGPTLADGLAGNIEPGSVTVGLVARYAHQLVTVTEDEIRAALRYLAAERGYVAEGAGAVPVAALLAGKVAAHGRVVAVVSGRNITAAALASVLAAGEAEPAASS